jgi:hypothetical protein
MEFICSETEDGRFIVQTPNQWGGLYPVVEFRDDCRNTAEVFAKIQEYWVECYPDPVNIQFYTKTDLDNGFTRG